MSNTIREPPGWNPPPWVAVRPTAAYFKAAGMPPEACKAWVLDTMRGCMTGEREEGSDADRLLRDAAERMAKRSNAGRVGANARWRRDANALRTDCERNAGGCQDRTGHERRGQTGHTRERHNKRPTESESGIEGEDSPDPTRPPTRPPPTADYPDPDPDTENGNGPRAREALERFDADPYRGNYPDLPDELLPNGAVIFCEEDDPDRALRTYQRELQRIGPTLFREVFRSYMDSILEGHEPTHRGRTLVSRLKLCPTQKR